MCAYASAYTDRIQTGGDLCWSPARGSGARSRAARSGSGGARGGVATEAAAATVTQAAHQGGRGLSQAGTEGRGAGEHPRAGVGGEQRGTSGSGRVGAQPKGQQASYEPPARRGRWGGQLRALRGPRAVRAGQRRRRCGPRRMWWVYELGCSPVHTPAHTRSAYTRGGRAPQCPVPGHRCCSAGGGGVPLGIGGAMRGLRSRSNPPAPPTGRCRQAGGHHRPRASAGKLRTPLVEVGRARPIY